MSVVLLVCVWLAAGVLAVAAWLWATRQRTSIPGPPTLPLLGNATTFYKLPVLLDRLGELHRRYGDIFRLYVGPKLIIMVTQPKDVQQLLATGNLCERDPYITYLLSTFQGNGILVNKGQVWKNHRKVIERGFHNEELEKFMETFNDGGSFLCERLAELNGAETEMSILITWCSLRLLGTTIFCLDAEKLVPDWKEQIEKTTQLVCFANAFSRILYRPWETISFFKWMTEDGRALIRLNNLAKEMVWRAMTFAKANISNMKISERSLLACIHPERDLGFPFTEKDIHDEAITLTAAGIETTSDAIGFVMTLLGLHPEWQEKAQQELDEVFGTGGDYLRPTTTEDLARLTVLDAILKETLRLFPTVPCMPYLVKNDTPLAGGRYVAPQGSTVLVAYYLMHRQPQLFAEPHRFDPGRFLEGGSATSRKPYSYIPFGIGPRKCVGGRFAILQIKVVLAMVLRRYRILPGSTRQDLEESVLSITVHPLTGFRVTCIPRRNAASGSL